MATYQLDDFASISHTLTIEPDGFDAWGFRRWRYQLTAGTEVIFTGNDLTTPEFHSQDKAAAGALAFLTLRPGDVEAGYFTDHAYTQAQIDWRDTHAEDLSLALITEDGELETLTAYRQPGPPADSPFRVLAALIWDPATDQDS